MNDPLHPIVVPPTLPHTHTVIFLHGRGDTAEHFQLSLANSIGSHNKSLKDIFPSIRWVFPKAVPSRLAAAPQQTWSQWFDIWDTRDFSIHEEIQAVGLRASVSRMRNLVHEEASLLDGHYNRIVLMGISQGAATAIHTLLNLNIPREISESRHTEQKLAAFVGFSCRMPFPGRCLEDTRRVLDLGDTPEDDVVLTSTPFLLEHCYDDPVVLINNGRNLKDTLERFGADVVWKEYADGGHWFNSPHGIDDAAAFLQHTLGVGFEEIICLDTSESTGSSTDKSMYAAMYMPNGSSMDSPMSSS